MQLKVCIFFNDARLRRVLADIMALTKLGLTRTFLPQDCPRIFRFTYDIGELLTAIPALVLKPFPF